MLIAFSACFSQERNEKTKKLLAAPVVGLGLAGPPIEQDGAVRVWAFVYFPPKPGKFAGYGNEWNMEWNGRELERIE